MFIALHILEGLSSEAVYHTPKFDWVWTDYPFSGCDCEFHELWITPQHILTSVFVAMTVLACSAVKFPLPALFSHTRFREFFFWMPGGLAGPFRSTEQAKLHRTLVAVWIVLIINFYSLFAFIGHVLHSFGGFSIHAALSFAIPDPTPGGLGLVIALAYFPLAYLMSLGLLFWVVNMDIEQRLGGVIFSSGLRFDDRSNEVDEFPAAPEVQRAVSGLPPAESNP